ncbi:MAG: CDP-diacylglycerol--serine O-phosphatidyltransferase [Acidobacteria bacterium]|nr:CDP-diacylglycerol--serine O-phosphatidyltransferase [Acidobacteriota bacterium]
MADKRTRKRIRDRARFQTGLSILPSLFTVGNIFCGYFSIIATLRGNYDHAAIAIGVGWVLDTLDGRIARLTKTSSEFGVQLDSLADVITFGVAPAMLALHWGLGSVSGMEASIAKHVNQLGWLATFAFVMCGALRLARFNISTNRPPEAGSKRYFVGLPIPAGAGLIAAVVHFVKSPILSVGSALLWCLLILLISFLMISTVRYSSFKELDMNRIRPRMALLATAMFIYLAIFYSEIVLLPLATIYVSSGLIAKVVQIARWLIRRFLPGNLRHSEPAHGNIES